MPPFCLNFSVSLINFLNREKILFIHMCNSYISCLGGVNYLGHFLPVCLGIQWSFRQENGMFFGSNAELVVESVMPDL